jgi:hypothetical protein
VQHYNRTSSDEPSLNIFPLARQKELVAQSARELDRLQGAEADQYWILLCRRLGAKLAALGCSLERVRLEILAFQEAVLSVLNSFYREVRVG